MDFERKDLVSSRTLPALVTITLFILEHDRSLSARLSKDVVADRFSAARSAWRRRVRSGFPIPALHFASRMIKLNASYVSNLFYDIQKEHFLIK